MKQIIGGKIYDTEKAVLIGKWNNGYFGNDFNVCSEKLWKSQKNQYFIAGEGGALSKYAENYGNSTGSGERIDLLSLEEARKWAEKHLSAEKYQEEFQTEKG